MRIVDRPTFAPGLCLVSKKGGNRPMIDLERDFDFDHEGRMYIDVKAAETLGRAVDMWTSEDLADLENRHRNALAEIESLKLEVERLNEALDAVRVVTAVKRERMAQVGGSDA